MQSLGDDTLAAFMRSDLSKEFTNVEGKASGEIGAAKTNNTRTTESKDDSEIAKYFKDSLGFLSKDTIAVKENTLATNAEKNAAGKYSKDVKDAVAGTNKSKKKQYRKRITEVEAKIAKSSNSTDTSNSTIRANNTSTLSAENSRARLDRTKGKSCDGTTNSSIEISSNIGTADRCKLSSWGLPRAILRKYEARGVTEMFQWQVECLSNHELLVNNRNLVYSAPTSAGKTLVAEILLIKAMIERRKKAIFILPFVSVVREKMYYFQDLLIDSGLRVEGFMGGCSPPGGFAAIDLAIATIEKANSLLNQLMEEGRLESLGAVVIDELHLLGDPYRGYLLELLLTKLRYMSVREESVRVQLIGMSATLPNLGLLANWLNAELYKTDFRPVPLEELCKIGATIYDNEMKSVRDLPIVSSFEPDSDNILQLCIETISAGNSVLIFCPTKNWCEKLARQIATMFYRLGREETPIGRVLREQLCREAIVETLEQLKRSPAGLDDSLKNSVSFGTAYHHAGLTMDERDVIEGAFRSGALRVLTATSTLSSGVNLPARRVIIRSLMFHGRPLDTLTYKQMIGRAGRMGKDTAGESILVCKTNETRAAKALLTSDLPPIKSCLEHLDPLKRALLEAVSSEVAYTADDIQLYTRCTLASVTNDALVDELTRSAVEFLVENEFLMLQANSDGDERWVATQLGKACLAASIPPIDGLLLFEELRKARQCFVLDTELHVIYLVTPFSSSSQMGHINWLSYLNLWKNLGESEKRVGQLVGVDEIFLMTAVQGSTRTGRAYDIHKRFYTALALHELVREIPLVEVSRKYNCCRGVIQSLQQNAATFAGMVTQFCKKLGWGCLELLVGQFQARLQFGVCRELLDLLRLPMLNGLRARSLYKEGITSVAELAAANALDVERALHKALPFESGKEFDGEHEFDVARRNRMRCVFVTGRDGLTLQQAAVILVREARNLVQNELGVDDLRWKDRSSKIDRSLDGNSAENSIDRSGKLPDEIEESRKNLSKSRNDENRGVMERENAEIIEIMPENRDFSRAILSDARKASDSCSVSPTKAPESPNTGSSVDRKAFDNANTRKFIDSKKSTKSGETIVSDEDRDVEISRASSEKNISDITSAEIDRDENVIGSDTRREICADDVFAFTDNETAVDTPTNADAPAKDDNCSEDIFEFSNIENLDDFDADVIGPKTAEEICKIGTFEFLDNIDNQKSNDVASENPVEPLPVSINDFTDINDVFDRKEASGSENCYKNPGEIFKFVGNARKSINPRKNSLESTKRNSLASPLTSLRKSSTKDPDSRSPSLFGDSFNLDTQDCNMLERNVIDSLNVSTFGDTNIFVESLKNTPEKRRSDSARSNRRSNTSLTRRLSLRNSAISRQSPRTSEANNASKSLIWSDDSWNNTNGVIENVDPAVTRVFDKNHDLQTPPASDKIAGKSISLQRSRSDHEDRLLPKSWNDLSQNKAHKRKSSESNISPIGNFIKITQTRKFSVDSNKSDSDDVVIASQSVRASNELMKNRTRMKLESLRKSRTQKTAEKIDENRHKRDLLCEKCSVESIVLSSDEEISPVKRRNLLTRKKKIVIDGDSRLEKKAADSPKINLDHNGTRAKKVASVCPGDVKVVNVASNWAKFNQFKRDVFNNKDIAIALACETFLKDTISIGTKIIGITGTDGRKKTKKIENCVYDNKKICGIALSWDGIVVHYVSFDNTSDNTESKVPVKERLDLIADILNSSDLTIRCFSVRDTYKILYNCCRISSSCKFLDPKTADWLLDPEHSDRSFNTLIAEHLSKAQFMLQRAGNNLYGSAPGFNVKSAIPSEIRATTEAALTWHLMNALLVKLEARSSTLLKTFREIEMGTLILLARMELTGFGVNFKSLQELSRVIQEEMSELENRAYNLAGRTFNFSSSKSVAQVLDLYKGKKVSTNKAVLEHCENPIARLVISWRKLSTTQIKVILPLLSMAECNSRIHGNCVTNTVTGRISMHEPNLQSVPRDFNSEDDSFVMSVRMAFVSMQGNLLLSADYCQLELRIMAHFSKEANLCRILREEGDVFKNIAARWYNVAEEMIDDNMRQRTKQLCYGMIYGMGVKTLAETLAVTEPEAKEFLESFMGAYPGIRRWLTQVVEEARIDGYVTTLMARRRYLPALNSDVASERSQAERQAVNTKVQGTAADITKKAMVKINEKIRREFPDAPLVLVDNPVKRKLRSSENLARGGYLVLQLHDELLYEVNEMDLKRIGKIIKESMEKSCELRVPLPVKIKIGPAWGDLTETDLESL